MSPNQILPALVAAAAAATLLTGCGGGNDVSASSPSKLTSSAESPAAGESASAVTISDFKFTPASFEVSSGAQVAVTNDDTTAHTATADDGTSFDTGTLDPKASQTVSVSKPGHYAYHCDIHPFMKGTLVVQ